jgi:GWxTD domain-containing protein
MHRSCSAPVRVLRRALLLAFLAAACSRGGRTPPPGGGPTAPPGAPGTATAPRAAQSISFDATPLFRQMGMLARGLPFPLVGRAAFAASGTPDSTHVIVAITFANATLAFAREADNRFRANYTISVTLARDAVVVASTQAEEQLLVGSYRETTRTDESVIHQEILDAAPGRYTLTVAVRDEGSQRTAQEQITITVPRLGETGLSTPMPIAEVTPRASRDAVPLVLMSPAATAVAGRDSILPVYLESYGDTTTPVRMLIRSERGRIMWNDTVRLAPRGALRAGVVEVPVSRLGIGVAQLTFLRDGASDSSSAYVFVGFGGDLPVATFDDMLNYLRWFAQPHRIQKLRDASEETRPAAWAEFVRETDDRPETPMHELLREYFGRLIRANGRFREEATPGWMSDRGRVFVALGEPDQLVEPQVADFSRGRQQLWDYRSLNMQLVFYDQTGTGRWRLTQSSEVRFESEFRRRLK